MVTREVGSVGSVETRLLAIVVRVWQEEEQCLAGNAPSDRASMAALPASGEATSGAPCWR